MKFLKAKAALSAQSQVEIERQTEAAAGSERQARIRDLQERLVPAASSKIADAEREKSRAEKDLEALDKEERSSDGNEASLDNIERRRRAARFRVRSAQEVAQHNFELAAEMDSELRRLEAEEARERLEAEALRAEERALELAELLAESYAHHRSLLEEWEQIYGRWAEDLQGVRNGAQGRMIAARQAAATQLVNRPGFQQRSEIWCL